MEKLFSIPNFSSYYITKSGNIFDSISKQVYSNGDKPVKNAVSYLWDSGKSSTEIKNILKIPNKTVINYINQDKGSTTIEKHL